MITFIEYMAQECLKNQGYEVKRKYPTTSKEPLIKGEIGECDFLIINKTGEEIYVEVKNENQPLYENQKKYIEKMINKNKKVWIFVCSRLGSYLIFEVKKRFKINLIKKGFFNTNKKKFYITDSNRIKLLDLRNSRRSILEHHLNELKKIRKI